MPKLTKHRVNKGKRKTRRRRKSYKAGSNENNISRSASVVPRPVHDRASAIERIRRLRRYARFNARLAPSYRRMMREIANQWNIDLNTV